MTESATNRTNEELHARLAKLEAEVARLTEIADESLKLMKTVGRLEPKLDVLWDGFLEYRSKRNEWFKDAFDRIMNLEMFVFPNLVRDMQSVHRIIGPEGEESPFDTRKTSPGAEQ
jgi:hypothetical protein